MVKTIIKEIARNLYILRLDDDSIRYFEALWYIPEGITYNSYIYLGSETRILFDTWKIGYDSMFIEALREVIEPKDIDYLVVHHMEPDHSGAIAPLIELNPRIKILGHPLVKNMMESFYGVRNANFRPVKDLEELDIGDEKIKFIYTPWLHWPETIMSYLYNLKTLFTGDVFGAYSIPNSIFSDELSHGYIDFMRKYFVNVIGHYRQHVEKNINKLLGLGLDVRLIAPLHGALWRDFEKAARYYIGWSRGEGVKGKVTIVYSSMYGFVEKAIRLVKELLESHGVNISVHKITDKYRSEISDILSDIIDSSAIVLGAATYEASVFPYMDYIINQIIRKTSPSKPVLIISSYGWGGVAGKMMKSTLSRSGFNVIDVIEYKGLLDDNVKARIKESVERIIRFLGRTG